MKTKKALRLRVRKTGTGKLVRFKSGRRHLLSNKSGKFRRQARRPLVIANALAKKYASVMPD